MGVKSKDMIRRQWMLLYSSLKPGMIGISSASRACSSKWPMGNERAVCFFMYLSLLRQGAAVWTDERGSIRGG